MQTYHNKVVWVTGASSGYGKALALAFLEAGAKVIVSARNKDKLLEIARISDDIGVIPLNLNNTDTFAKTTEEAIACFGHIDILINNGAIAQTGSALETYPHVARQIMEVDYFSHTELTRCILPHFIKRKGGHVVVVSGLLARITLPGRSSYAAAKAALFGYFGCLRAEVAEHNIDVTILIPGAMQTDLTANALKANGSIVGGEPSGGGCPVDVAAAQSIEVITNKRYEAYIGDAKGAELWKLSLQHPNKAIQIILAQVKGSE